MSTRLSQFREYAADTFQLLSDTNRASARILSQVPIAGAIAPIGLARWSDILGGIADLIREDDDDEVFLNPPFEGGQGDGASYAVSFIYNGENVQGFEGEAGCSQFDPIIGPVGGATVRRNPGDPNIDRVFINHAGPNSPRAANIFGGLDQNDPVGRVSITSVTRCDGLPDDDGDTPSRYDPGLDDSPLDDDGNLPLPDFPDWPPDWVPRVCGIELGPCPGLAICAGPFRAVVGPCGVDVGLNPDGLAPGEDGVDNVDPSPIGDLDVGGDGDDEISVPDDVESVWIEITSPVPPSVRVTHVSSAPDLVEYWLGFVSTGTNTGDGAAYDAGTPLQHGRNYYRLESCLEDRTVKVRSPQGTTWRVTDTGERTGRCGSSTEDTEAS